MILVTVGTTMPFDELLEQVDVMAGAGGFGDEDVLCQSGQSTYQMRHAQQFRGRPTLRDLIAEASFVITHGGATVIELLLGSKLFVAFPNPRGAGNHQATFLSELARHVSISWSRDLGDLAELVATRRAVGPAHLATHFPRAADIIRAVRS